MQLSMTTLMLAGIKDYLVITCEEYQKLFQELLGDGKKWGINIQYALQKNQKDWLKLF